MPRPTSVYPDNALRRQLTQLGIPPSRQHLNSLLSLVPLRDESLTDPDAAAEVIIYLVRHGIIKVPLFPHPASVAELSYGHHICKLYRSKQELLDILVPYFQDGLRAGDYCFWIVSPPLTVSEARQALSVTDEEFAGLSNQLRILFWDEWYLHSSGRMKAKSELLAASGAVETEAIRRGFQGVRVSGDTSWVTTAALWRQLIDYEKEGNAALRGTKTMAICTYPMALGGPHISEVLSSHHRVPGAPPATSVDAPISLNLLDEEPEV